MARSRSGVLSLALLALVALMAAPSAFVSAPAARSSSEVIAPAVAAAFAPLAANAQVDVVPDMDSSMSLAAMIEPIMWGMVLGVFPITTLGLYVAAWLQFKKGPTLGL
mmetsp:Transcript_34455/g.80569  ORF Transcript_34455/g.80569 Transcript_34455/m.80569 type:complete len:108 (+) Transcript_34455:97-420(+)|eukprot:CAMPEP_0178403820 /NCGR_PEP_ID=MMETSP0689_2-20121128/17566_1 /TAXON_ID=160604 /ORGANISM="Amphidinium massartii, Strain CS-259" /LENGTH=107 /DNA_ID=CAMNT_0020024787 /DNA_START=97 /DNA_END=420 /DNA_ORIENTATION=-